MADANGTGGSRLARIAEATAHNVLLTALSRVMAAFGVPIAAGVIGWLASTIIELKQDQAITDRDVRRLESRVGEHDLQLRAILDTRFTRADADRELGLRDRRVDGVERRLEMFERRTP
jgi:hypothetical protein